MKIKFKCLRTIFNKLAKIFSEALAKPSTSLDLSADEHAHALLQVAYSANLALIG
jgi:hypothetical protein